MNSKVQALKDKLRNISQEKGIDFNSVMRFYMYDRFVERLSKSEYRDNFILKGGFYLSNLFGINNRSTMDIDTALRRIDFTKENVIQMIEEIINIDVNDDVKFAIDKIDTIRDEDEYGGLRVTINFTLENIKDKFHIDLGTGDPIYPGPDNYGYESLIGNEIYKVWTYNLETILAEKIETIFSRLEANSRMKDYYDVYLIYKLRFEKINRYNFKKAVEKTFKNRGFDVDLSVNLNIIKNSIVLKNRWVSYSRKNNYAKNLKFDDVVNSLEEFVKLLG